MHDLPQSDPVRETGRHTTLDNVLYSVREEEVELVPGEPSTKYVSKAVLADREYLEDGRPIDFAQGHGY